MKDSELVEKIVCWLRAELRGFREREWDVDGFVVGISGGIDSAVTAALCKRAFPEKTFGLYLPLFSDSFDEKCAEMVAKKFEIPLEKKDLENAFYAMTKKGPDSKERAAVKLRSKLRMAALYEFADSRGLLVCGTGTYDEFQLGYFTRWGDGACDLFPLGGLHKIEVKKLGKFLGVPDNVLKRPPSPGFFQGMTAETELGFSFEEFHNFFCGKKIDKKVREKIEKRLKRARHKTALPPRFELG